MIFPVSVQCFPNHAVICVKIMTWCQVIVCVVTNCLISQKFEVLRFLLFLYFLAMDFYWTLNVYSPSLFGEIKNNERK